MNITIITEAGGDVGLGHVVRMGHLYHVLKQRGHIVTMWANSTGLKYFSSAGIPAWTPMEGAYPEADITIVDFMHNDDNYLEILRPHCRKLVVIVGVGWTITPATRWIADLVVYHTVADRSLEDWTPGETVLQGLEYIMMDPNFSIVNTNNERQWDLAVYFGGGLHKRLIQALTKALNESEYKIFHMGGEGYLWDHSPYDTLANSKLYIGSMGMMAYEAITTRTYPMVFCRSEDHMESAQRLEDMNLLTNFGMTNKATKQNSVDNIMAWIETRYDKMASEPWVLPSYKINDLDGKGIYRVAREILDV
jgi:spore coat polysaccharide biosynthesis predicted glycosyltransferase SpsG